MNALTKNPNRNNGWEGIVFDVMTTRIIAKCQEYDKDWQRYSRDYASIELSVKETTMGEVCIGVSIDTNTLMPQLFELQYNEDPSDVESVCLIQGMLQKEGGVDIVKFSADLDRPEVEPISAGELERMLHVIDSV